MKLRFRANYIIEFTLPLQDQNVLKRRCENSIVRCRVEALVQCAVQKFFFSFSSTVFNTVKFHVPCQTVICLYVHRTYGI